MNLPNPDPFPPEYIEYQAKFDAWVQQLEREARQRDTCFALLVIGGIALVVTLHRLGL
jgi:hypothetical protein